MAYPRTVPSGCCQTKTSSETILSFIGDAECAVGTPRTIAPGWVGKTYFIS